MEVLAHDLSERRKRKAFERGLTFLSIGLSFILVAVVLRFSPGGASWWYWMFPAAAGMLGMGVANLLRVRREARPTLPPGPATMALPASHVREVSSRDTSEMLPLPSVTEGTTKLLDAESQRRRSPVPVDKKGEKS